LASANNGTPSDAESVLASAPEAWRVELEARLGADMRERVLAWIVPDLDAQLHFRESFVVLTNRQILHGDRPGSWSAWPISPDLSLVVRDRSGLGMLELLSGKARLAHWRYTLPKSAAAHLFVDQFEALREGRTLESEEPEERTCPSCGEPIPSGSIDCPACSKIAVVPPSASLFRLLRFASPRMGPVVLGLLLTLASTAASLIPTALTVPLIDDVLEPRQDFHLVKWYLLGLGGAAIIAWLLSWARTYVIAWVSERIASDLRTRTYEHLQQLSLEYFGGRRTGDLMTRLGTDTDRICNFLSINLLDFATDVIMIVMTAGFLVAMNFQLAVATLVPFPIIAFLVHRVRARLRRSLQRGNRAWSEMTSVLADTIPGIRVVKAFAQENREVQRFRAANDHVLQTNDRVNTTWSFFGPMVNLLTSFGLLVIWAFGSWQVENRSLSVGVLVAFNLYLSRFYVRLEAMSRMVQQTQRAATSANRIFEILDRTPSVAEPSKPVPIERLRGEIELREIGFRHGSRQILKDISLRIRPGEMIGLVGASGAGKSTLVNLVCRFYDVAEGSILVDGQDIRSYRVSDYRKNIGIVLQEPFLFYGSIAENIAYGKPDASRAEIVAAARAARCHEFILRLTDGYDSLVGERGQALSGGERQRISIARALLIDPRILILDEATSSVDTETEREIQQALDNLIRGRTTIAIAHRLSTLRKADRLVVMEKGRLVEEGKHQELIKTHGAYARLHKAQAELAAGATH
jgi:ATP-binding cassette subfamily B protein